MVIGQLALIDAALFSGAAIFVTHAEHPARLGTDDRAMLTEFKTSYSRGSEMQAPLAVIGGLLGLLQWYIYGGFFWFLGALLIFGNVPYTYAIMMPINKQLMAMSEKVENADTRAMIEKWGELHLIRTYMGAAATLLFFFASLF
jgi:hypothetical protein